MNTTKLLKVDYPPQEIEIWNDLYVGPKSIAPLYHSASVEYPSADDIVMNVTFDIDEYQ